MALGLELPEDTLTKLHEFQAAGESSGKLSYPLFGIRHSAFPS